METDLPQKRCNKCGEEHPATRVFFVSCNAVRDGLRPLCKECRKKERRKTTPVRDGYKRCSRCKRDLPATSEVFALRQRSKDKLNEYCRVCDKEIYEEKKQQPIAEDRPRFMICTGCGDEYLFTLDYFYREPTYRYGLNRVCKKCIDQRNRRYGGQHKVENAARAKRYRLRDLQKHLAYEAQQRVLHRDTRLLHEREQRRRDPARFRARRQRYLHTAHGKAQSRAYSRTRKMRMKRIEGAYSAQDVQRLYTLQQGRCHYCSVDISDGDYHVDHVIPVSRGGSNHPHNLALACPRCNMSKHNKLLSEWSRPFVSE